MRPELLLENWAQLGGGNNLEEGGVMRDRSSMELRCNTSQSQSLWLNSAPYQF
jgi:hypothetical protein